MTPHISTKFSLLRPFILFLTLMSLSLSAFGWGLNNQPEIYQGLDKGDVNRVVAAINRGDDVNGMYEGDTLLCWAIRKNNPDMIKTIISLPRTDVNKRSVWDDGMHLWDRTPLILAAHMGQAETVNLLIQRGAHLNDQDSVDGAAYFKGDTALIRAARRDHINVVRALFSHPQKPNIHITGNGGVAALWCAVENEDLEMTSFLYDHGAKVNQTNQIGASVLTACIEHKKWEVLDYLIAHGANSNLADRNGMTTLMYAVGSDDHEDKDHAKRNDLLLKFMEKFLTFKPKVDFQQVSGDSIGEAAIHIAARFGGIDFVQLLLANGADLNLIALGHKGTPLHNAATGKKVKMVTFLLSQGAKREIQNGSGLTPLMISTIQCDPDSLLALIKGCAMINTRSSMNALITPLVFAASNNNPLDHKKYLTIMELLLDNQGDINFASTNGTTPLIAAAQSSNLSQAYDKVKLLVNRGADLNKVNNRKESALMLATGMGNEKVVKWLIDKGADTQLKNGAGESVMSYSNRRGDPSINGLLESKGVKAEGNILKAKVVVGALIGKWQGSQEGLAQSMVMTFVFTKNNTYAFVSKLKPEILKQFPTMNPIIATHKGSYTVDNDTLIL